MNDPEKRADVMSAPYSLHGEFDMFLAPAFAAGRAESILRIEDLAAGALGATRG